MKIFKSFGILIMILSFLGCGGTSNVQTAKTTDRDLSTYDSFAYLPNSSAEISGTNYNDEQVNTAIIETINMNMQEAGYNLNRENPDLLVLVSTKTELETETTTQPMYARYPYGGATARTVSPFYNNYYYSGFNRVNNIVGYDTDTYQYEEGTLVINLVDRETQETVWKGVASENIYNQSTTGAIQELVNDIFEQYPLNQE